MSWSDWFRAASSAFRRGRDHERGTRFICKRGDIAIVSKGRSNLGRVVTVVAHASREELEMAFSRGVYDEGPFWRVDTNLRWVGPYGETLAPYAPDSHLRPLRPGEGEDEILRIAGKPVDQKVPA